MLIIIKYLFTGGETVFPTKGQTISEEDIEKVVVRLLNQHAKSGDFSLFSLHSLCIC
jgi:hypothetical protein